ncbi:MAG: YoaK family protein [Eubacteriales bacterium]
MNLFRRIFARPSGEIYESFPVAALLTLSGGFQDAYTYYCRSGVFANAQTGNIVFMGANVFSGKWDIALRYAVPVLAFTIGIYIAEAIHRRKRYIKSLKWRQIILLFEFFVLFTVGFIPQSLNILANSLVSFVCALQVQTFRRVNGSVYASTMCIGNIRSATEAFGDYISTREKSALAKSADYLTIIIFFAVGAGIGSLSAGKFGGREIWFSAALMLVCFTLMFIKPHDDASSGA